MRKVVVHEELVRRVHRAPRLSLAFWFVVLLNVAGVIVPYLLCRAGEGRFWMTENFYREKPRLSFKYNFLLALQTNETQEIFVSSEDGLNMVVSRSYRPATVSMQETENSFVFEASVPLLESEKVMTGQCLLFFDAAFDHKVRFSTEAVAHTSFGSPLGLSRLDTKGSLALRQSKPLGVRNHVSQLYPEQTPLLNDSPSPSAEDGDINRILLEYRNRNVRLDFVESYPIAFPPNAANDGLFRVKMEVSNNELQRVEYVPRIGEVLKDGWIRYLSIYVVCWFVLDNFKRRAFRSNWVASTKRLD